jgi:hypothetical protein
MTVVVRGKAEDIEKGADFTPTPEGHGNGPILNHLAGFRVDGKPVVLRTRQMASIKHGDEVVAAGGMKNGTLEAIALRNVTTGATYGPPIVPPAILIGIMGLIGLSTLGLLGLGYLILAIAAFAGWKLWQAAQANAAVKA